MALLADNSRIRSDFRIYIITGDGIVHNPGYSWELLPGATKIIYLKNWSER